MENLHALQAINPKNELVLSNECSIKVGNKYFTEDQSIIEIGLDEVGRGVLFGRVYAGAVILPKDKNTTFDFSKI
jgi:ribonuclease HIII